MKNSNLFLQYSAKSKGVEYPNFSCSALSRVCTVIRTTEVPFTNFITCQTRHKQWIIAQCFADFALFWNLFFNILLIHIISTFWLRVYVSQCESPQLLLIAITNYKIKNKQRAHIIIYPPLALINFVEFQ